jgi:hypothetical protein
MTDCLIKLTYYDKSEKKHYYKYHVAALNLDQSVKDQVYNLYGHLIPLFTDFKWQEVNF